MKKNHCKFTQINAVRRNSGNSSTMASTGFPKSVFKVPGCLQSHMNCGQRMMNAGMKRVTLADTMVIPGRRMMAIAHKVNIM